MHAFVINLEKSAERRAHMTKILSGCKGIDAEFVVAVDGRGMSEEEKRIVFDVEKSEKHYAKRILPGEIGCTLSHQKCYKKLTQDKDLEYALILEDDIMLKSDLNSAATLAERYVQTKKPVIVLLSGWFWYTSARSLASGKKIAKVWNAYLTQSYVINKAAAQVLSEEKPFIRADDWRYIKRKGVKLLALVPHAVNQDWSGSLPSTLYAENPMLPGHLFSKLRIHFNSLVMRFLNFIGHYEEAE